MTALARTLALGLATVVAGCTSIPPATAPASVSSVPSPVPRATARPTATPQSTPSAWLSLIDPGWAGAAWSPDGRWLMVWRRPMNAPLDQSELDLDRPDGTVVARFNGTGDNDVGGFVPTWLDPTHFLAIRSGRVVIGGTDSLRLAPFPVSPGLGLASNGRGAVAMVDATVSVSAATATFVVTTATGTTSPRPGIPQGWSHDGTRLVVWRWRSGEGMETLGWLEILSWPGLRTVAAFPHDLAFSSTSSALFDLTDRYFLGEDARLHDLVTGTKSPVLWAGDQVVDARWNAADQVVGADLTDGRAIAYDIHGHQAFATGPIGDDISGSRDGSVIALWFGDTGGSTLTLLSSGLQRQLVAPGSVQANVLFSPDGSELVIGSLGAPLLLRRP